MNCEYILQNEMHAKYLLKTLSYTDEAEYKNHLSACKSCRQDLETQRLLISGIRDAGKTQLKAEIQRQVRELRQQKSVFDWPYLYRAAAIIFLFAMLPGLVYYYLNIESPEQIIFKQEKSGIEESAPFKDLDEREETKKEKLAPISEGRQGSEENRKAPAKITVPVPKPEKDKVLTEIAVLADRMDESEGDIGIDETSGLSESVVSISPKTSAIRAKNVSRLSAAGKSLQEKQASEISTKGLGESGNELIQPVYRLDHPKKEPAIRKRILHADDARDELLFKAVDKSILVYCYQTVSDSAEGIKGLPDYINYELLDREESSIIMSWTVTEVLMSKYIEQLELKLRYPDTIAVYYSGTLYYLMDLSRQRGKAQRKYNTLIEE